MTTIKDIPVGSQFIFRRNRCIKLSDNCLVFATYTLYTAFCDPNILTDWRQERAAALEHFASPADLLPPKLMDLDTYEEFKHVLKPPCSFWLDTLSESGSKKRYYVDRTAGPRLSSNFSRAQYKGVVLKLKADTVVLKRGEPRVPLTEFTDEDISCAISLFPMISGALGEYTRGELLLAVHR